MAEKCTKCGYCIYATHISMLRNRQCLIINNNDYNGPCNYPEIKNNPIKFLSKIATKHVDNKEPSIMPNLIRLNENEYNEMIYNYAICN
jgi:hypothetical protein